MVGKIWPGLNLACRHAVFGWLGRLPCLVASMQTGSLSQAPEKRKKNLFLSGLARASRECSGHLSLLLSCSTASSRPCHHHCHPRRRSRPTLPSSSSPVSSTFRSGAVVHLPPIESVLFSPLCSPTLSPVSSPLHPSWCCPFSFTWPVGSIRGDSFSSPPLSPLPRSVIATNFV